MLIRHPHVTGEECKLNENPTAYLKHFFFKNLHCDNSFLYLAVAVCPAGKMFRRINLQYVLHISAPGDNSQSFRANGTEENQ